MPFEYLLLAQVYALKRYHTLAPSERWSLGQIGQLPNTWAPEVSKYAFFPRELRGMKPENMVELARDEIKSRADDLEFKRKRWDELLCFRHALDELFDRAKHFQDQQAAVEYAVDEIGIALRDISRAMGERDLKASLLDSKGRTELERCSHGRSRRAELLDPHLDFLDLELCWVLPFRPFEFASDCSLLQPKNIPTDCKDYAYLYHAAAQFGVDEW